MPARLQGCFPGIFPEFLCPMQRRWGKNYADYNGFRGGWIRKHSLKNQDMIRFFFMIPHRGTEAQRSQRKQSLRVLCGFVWDFLWSHTEAQRSQRKQSLRVLCGFVWDFLWSRTEAQRSQRKQSLRVLCGFVRDFLWSHTEAQRSQRKTEPPCSLRLCVGYRTAALPWIRYNLNEWKFRISKSETGKVPLWRGAGIFFRSVSFVIRSS